MESSRTLQSCDLQKLASQVLPAAPALKDRTGEPATASPPKPPPDVADEKQSKFQDRRLIVMLFDFSSMQPAEQIRAVDAALKFLGTQMTASDTVSVMVFGSTLKTVQDFTDDRDLLYAAIKGFHIGESSELASMADTGADSEDQSGAFVADETEFNIFNTDRKLAALEDAARRLSQYPEKKALVYFSSGVEKTGVDNQSQLRATINTAVRSNVAFYPIDARGLVASRPGGDASASRAGRNQALQRQRASGLCATAFTTSRRRCYSLAADTGGKAMLDSNDLTMGIRKSRRTSTATTS